MHPTTTNNLEAVTMPSIDGCLALDQLVTISPSDAATVAYSLLNGKTRSRNHAGCNLSGNQTTGKSMMLHVASQLKQAA